MKPIAIFSFWAALGTALALGQCAVAQTTYTVIGGTTFGSDGSTATTIGGTTFVSGGSPIVQQSLGTTTPAQSATQSSTVKKIGNITFITDSSGKATTFQKIGNITFGSDGSIVQKIGDTYFVTEGNKK
tara:strand:- start:150 stop:536 length:387 start_codon:yes stop_codon:yes gene_type:complete